MENFTFKKFLLFAFLLFTVNVFGQTLLTENFGSGTALPPGWLVTSDSTGNNWVLDMTNGTSGSCLAYYYNSAAPANTWAFSPNLAMTAGTTYVIQFKEKTQSSSYPEKLKVTLGQGQNVNAQTNILADLTLINTTYEAKTYVFDCPISGNYNLAFNCHSDADMYNLFVDDVSVFVQDTTQNLNVNLSANQVICAGSEAFINSDVFGGSGSYTYIWASTPPDTNMIQNQPMLYAFPSVTTTYTLTVFDDLTMQSGTASIVINVNPAPFVDFMIQPIGPMTYRFVSIISGLAPGDSIAVIDWSFGDGNMTYDSTTVQHIYTNGGTYEVTLFVSTTNGCYKNVFKFLNVMTGPQLMVNAGSDRFICEGTSVNVSPAVSGPGTLPFVYYWTSYPEDLSLIPNNANQTLHPYTTTTYIINVASSDTVPSVGKDTLIVNVNLAPSTSIYYNTTDSIGLTYSFEAYTWNGTAPFSYHWNFGDGTTSNLQNPVHSFNSSGTYHVSILVTDAIGCFYNDTAFVYVQQHGFCHASFTYTIPDTINNPHNVYFINHSTGNISEYYWDFGDGTYSNQMNTAHNYHFAGIYNVGLSIYDSATYCWDYFYQEIQVGNIYDSCWANFTYTATSGLNIQFTDASLHANEYYWYFGDGYSSTEKNPLHTFPYSGQFWVDLSTMDTLTNCWSYKSKLVNVGSTFCYVNFNYTINSAQNKISLTADCDASIRNYLWDFGDNTTSTLKNPEKIYAQPGMYNVCLSASDSSGQCINSYCLYLQVGVVDCNASFTAVVVPNTNTVNFANSTQSSSTQLFWDFGDGSFSYAKNPSHTYTYSGFYNVYLSIYDTVSGCWDYFIKEITVGSAANDCVADFQYFVLMANNKVFFTNKSLGSNLTDVIWYFGDGSSDTTMNPVHQYSSPGYYDICLSVANPSGICYNTTCKYVLVGNDPNACLANFTLSADTVTKKVTFRDASSSTPASAFWDFGDGQWSSDANPVHQYSTSGVYLAYYYIFTSGGCFSDAVKVVNLTSNTGIIGLFTYRVDSTNAKANSYPVSYKGAAFGDPARMTWSFGDGAKDSLKRNVTHEYAAEGTYNVSFTVSDPVTGQSNTSTKAVNVTGIKKYDKPIENFHFYPNPMKNNADIYFTLKQDANVQIWLTDIAGKSLAMLDKSWHSSGLNHISWNNNNLKPGLYFLHLQSRSQQMVSKIMIIE